VQFDMWECTTDQPFDEVITRILAGRTRVRHY
jgi:hypothetical protein